MSVYVSCRDGSSVGTSDGAPNRFAATVQLMMSDGYAAPQLSACAGTSTSGTTRTPRAAAYLREAR